jgi:predicted phosphodiesterase
VRGNNDCPDKWPAGDRDRLAALPPTLEIELPGGLLAAVHGDRLPARDRHLRLRRLFPRASAVVYGHSHRLVLDLDERPWVLNPGAGGRSRTFGGPSCLVLSAEPGGWTVRSLRFEPLPRPPDGSRGRPKIEI